ncbi:hypothetical protein ABZS29_06375 [Kribbella sp. NPDC005582]|uniref:hypothetical protein n=1 Tax=Kribbella sp. NPDC005582 TaxID=3156893 RepID=UPI0033BDB6FE
MWTRHLVATLLAAPLVGAVLSGTPTALAAPNPDLTVHSVTVDKTRVAVAGLNTVPVTITVKASYNFSEPEPPPGGFTLYAILQRYGANEGPLNDLYSSPLTVVDGTVRNGTWRGKVDVPSTANGTFEIFGLKVGRFDPASGDNTDPTTYPNPVRISVSGQHVPRITARVTPNPVPPGKPYSVRWSVIDSATKQPYGTRLKVLLGNDNGCVERVGTAGTVLTDTAGYITKSYAAADADFLNCLLLPGTQAPVGGLSMRIPHPSVVTATPSKASAPVGTIVLVNGTVAGSPAGCPVNLQRLYGASQWRTVGTASVRQSGRFTLNAQPAYRGRIPYRAQMVACRNYLTGYSKVFHITGT